MTIFIPNCFAMNWQTIELKGFQKEKISDLQIRFKSKNLAVHIQVDTFEKPWDPKSINQDIDEMFKKRIPMYDFFGFSEVQYENYKLDNINNHQDLKIFGSYKKPDNKKIYFIENNIYFAKKFIQLKLISQEKKININDLENILKEIDISKVEI
jgi:hypothetical protein